MSTAENTVHKAMEVGKPYATPVLQSLDGPIKKVDGIICSGLDYVEAKVPAVKLPPGEVSFLKSLSLPRKFSHFLHFINHLNA